MISISTWRRRSRKAGGGRRAGDNHQQPELEVTIPTHFRCPISLDFMKDPVTLSTGITYDRESIESWIESGNYTCPVTNQALINAEQIPNHTIRKMIQDWCVKNRSYGIERIPTPRVPVTSIEVMEILSEIMDSTRVNDQSKCRNLVMKIRNKGKESDRNKKCIKANGAGWTLSAVFKAFAAISFEKFSGLLEEILSALTLMFPLDREAASSLASPDSLNCLVRFLNSGDLTSRQNAVLAIKEMLSLGEEHVDALARIEGAKEAIVKLIKEPICPTSTKASLMVVYYMVSSFNSRDEIRTEFADMGLVELLLENLVDTEKSLCEKALGVLDGLCCSEEAREKAYSHALTIPVIVKKILRVSDMATEFSVSIIWKLCKFEKRDDGGVLVEALQVGAFQKLLLLLQVGCCEMTKEKASELLKWLNLNRDKCECIDSMDFKGIKRSF
ncbi:U-box domain-containing protein 21-like [Telopea speciosissima]|uniref:U-box domain-containing protein 21-like n=1 Tax=Telopea speciosissima TaxID=54955 RepID=UPI001CC72CE9|nr:U-box domain-containing protein 21-like [Telopea speciosissima]